MKPATSSGGVHKVYFSDVHSVGGPVKSVSILDIPSVLLQFLFTIRYVQHSLIFVKSKTKLNPRTRQWSAYIII